MARRKLQNLAHVVLTIDTKNPIKVEDFAAAFTGMSAQYSRFVRAAYPDLAADTSMYVREVRKGSIEADLIPWAVQGLSSVVNVIEQIQIVEKFVRTYAGWIKGYASGKAQPDATRSDLKDFMGAVAAIANDPDGRATLRAVVFEDGKKKVKAAISFETVEAREIQRQIEDQRIRLEAPGNADHKRVLMVFVQSSIKDAPAGKRTGQRVIVEDVAKRDLPLVYASDLAEQRIMHEVREADENVFKKGFIVDVNVQLVGGKAAAFRVTNLHQVIDLPD